ncbi:MAG: PHP domain-containing protein [Halanaerobiales bacterium]|nr:PHP domain-containing protein [Halanaerobiales bacterium]
MQKYLMDLHIHSVLSPCADITMTPGNIVETAAKKGINIISITDHNTNKNIASALEIAKEKDIYLIPGIEVQSKEEIHLLSYFASLDDLNKYSNIIYNNLPNIKNDEEKFGYQIVVDKNDTFIKKEEKLLLNSTDLSINRLVDLTHKNNGICVPSHVDRSFGLIKNLGFIPEDLDISFIEMSSNKSITHYYKTFPYLKKYSFLKNSDSHYLNQIKPTMEIFLPKNISFKGLFEYFKTHNNSEYIL